MRVNQYTFHIPGHTSWERGVDTIGAVFRVFDIDDVVVRTTEHLGSGKALEVLAVTPEVLPVPDIVRELCFMFAADRVMVDLTQVQRTSYFKKD